MFDETSVEERGTGAIKNRVDSLMLPGLSRKISVGHGTWKRGIDTAKKLRLHIQLCCEQTKEGCSSAVQNSQEIYAFQLQWWAPK